MKRIDHPTFGTGGNSDSFYNEGYKSTTQAPSWIKKIGLDAYEFEAGNGLKAGEETLRKIGDAARENGILMSFHTPYFISLSGTASLTRCPLLTILQRASLFVMNTACSVRK